MGWIARLFRAVPKEEMEGIRLDGARWEIDGPETFAVLLTALQGWLPDDSVLYFEGGEPDKQLSEFLAAYSIQERAHIAMGTIWPRPKVFHVPASEEILMALAEIMEHHSEQELATHFHVYFDNKVLLEWYDAFSGCMQVSGLFSENQISSFANQLGRDYRRLT